MVYALLKILYNIYFAGCLFFILAGLSTAVFRYKKMKRKAGLLFKHILHALIWPLDVFSADGREKLTRILKETQ